MRRRTRTSRTATSCRVRAARAAPSTANGPARRQRRSLAAWAASADTPQKSRWAQCSRQTANCRQEETACTSEMNDVGESSKWRVNPHQARRGANASLVANMVSLE